MPGRGSQTHLVFLSGLEPLGGGSRSPSARGVRGRCRSTLVPWRSWLIGGLRRVPAPRGCEPILWTERLDGKSAGCGTTRSRSHAVRGGAFAICRLTIRLFSGLA